MNRHPIPAQFLGQEHEPALTFKRMVDAGRSVAGRLDLPAAVAGNAHGPAPPGDGFAGRIELLNRAKRIEHQAG